MKKLVAVVVALLCLMGTALCDTITIDTDMATPEDIKAVIGQLSRLYADKTTEEMKLPQTATFENGHIVTVDSYDIADGTITIHYTFVHYKDRPATWMNEINCVVYQNGLPLSYAAGNEANLMKTLGGTLAGGECEIQLAYTLADESEVTVYLSPYFGSDYAYVRFRIK